MPLNQFSNQPQKAKPSVGLFLLYLFAAAALVIFIGYPKFTDWRTANKRVTADTQDLSTVQSEATQVKSEISNVQPTDAARIASAVPAAPNLPDLYAQVESLADASTVHLVSVQGIVDATSSGATGTTMLDGASADSSGTDTTASAVPAASATDASGNPVAAGPIKVATPPSNLGTVSLTVEVSGNYSAVQEFLNSLYTSLRIITVQQTVMTTGKSGATTGGASATSANAPATVDLKSQMQTYYTK